ncbi:flagellar biosynthetic protein FliO [Aneurinibacillus aneurinilyticus]|uniref:flagellar biosynthetic protein FliO n=1 Tax=Aneurinibacillus aneurinilyticus TaxID=1391 RepID=UPI002E1F8904|nr:flagellar biosynthetic protein FliO [Aneurinibacillus aneurinilyticus]MED0669331.1 flagellar biosynthetic protein FliO [Aneurinibacillus aneurinilyticus]
MRKGNIRTIGVFASFLLVSQHAKLAMASVPAPSELPSKEVELASQTPSMLPLLLQTVFALALIVAIIYFLLRFVGRRSQTFFGRTGIRTLGGCSLGPQKSLQIVQIGSALYIVGVGENITLLRCIDSAEEVGELLDTLEAKSESFGMTPLSLGEWISRFMKKEKTGKEEDLTAAFQMKMEEARKRRQSMEKELFTDGEKEDEK